MYCWTFSFRMLTALSEVLTLPSSHRTPMVALRRV
jgi:hypothetical protein